MLAIHAVTETEQIWEPSAAELGELERELIPYLQPSEKTRKEVPPTNVDYHRQYVGYTHNGKRSIYGSFDPDDKDLRSYESKHAVRICDDGPVFCGIVYNVKTKAFEEPQFNA